MLACGHDAAAQSPFFEDKTIRLVLGFSPGGISDLWGRALSRRMSQHIPGKPNIILQNMPGAGSLTAANYIYGVTPFPFLREFGRLGGFPLVFEGFRLPAGFPRFPPFV